MGRSKGWGAESAYLVESHVHHASKVPAAVSVAAAAAVSVAVVMMRVATAVIVPHPASATVGARREEGGQLQCRVGEGQGVGARSA